MRNHHELEELEQKRRRQFLFETILLGICGIGLGVSLFFSVPPETSTVYSSPFPSSILTAAVVPDTLEGQSEEWVPELPVRLVIPAIAVDAAIQYVGLDPAGTGEMAVPSNFSDVGWYQPGVQPGMIGSAVIAGHYNGKKIPKAVFYDLENLEIGDQVVIESANRIEDIFQVVDIVTFAHDDPTTRIFKSTDGKKRLNLITCGGIWLPGENQYDERTVVFTELVTDVE